MSIDHLLTSASTVQRKERASDGQGGWTETYTDHLIDEPCRRSAPSASDRTVAQQLGAIITHSVYFRPGTDVVYDDQVLVGRYVLHVEAVIAPSIDVYTKALCSEVQHGA